MRFVLFGSVEADALVFVGLADIGNVGGVRDPTTLIIPTRQILLAAGTRRASAMYYKIATFCYSRVK